MRVVTFNVHHGTVGRRGSVDPARLGAVCAGFEADLILLQEVDQETWRARGADLAAVAAQAAGMDHVFGPSRWFPGGRYGNALLVRGQVLEHQVVPLPLVPWWRLWQEPRTALMARVRVAGDEVTVACTHLAVPPRASGRQLAALVDHVAGAPRPLVLGGDLNRRRDEVAPFLAAQDLALVAHGPTFPAHRPRADLDHVVVSSELHVAAASVRRTPMSDHAALVVDLEIRA